MTTYSVAVGTSWHSSDNSPAPDYTCGHKHKSLDAAQKCGCKLYTSKWVRGNWQANARWHDYYIINNTTGHKA